MKTKEVTIIYDNIKHTYTVLLAAALLAALVVLHQAQSHRTKAEGKTVEMQWSADSTWVKGGWE